MFEIEYKGGNGVVLSTKKVSIVADPKTSLVGLKDLTVKDAVELATEARFAVNSEGAKLIIEGPGEYGVADFDITGVAAQRHLDTENDPKAATMYRIDNGEIRVALIGNIYEKLSEEQLENLGIVDIVIIPVGGGGYTLDAEGAATIVRAIDPKAVIPVHYNDGALKYEVPQAELEEFTKVLGASVEEAGTKYKLKNAAALPQTLTVIKLDRS
ncbi:MAG TPA: MBL fold metallo-hydrolase [Dongiaceae bacterium]|nr:MBL fold metallo-hydrolase [Dongiaceae bacterium]